MLNSRSLAVAVTAVLLAACAGGSDSAPPTSPPVVTPAPVPPGIISVSSSGLPAGASAELQIVGPLPGSSFSRTAAAGTNWGDVPAGRYTVTVRPVRTSLGVWVGNPSTFEVTVPSAAPVLVAATYRPAPSALAVTVSGLPANASAAASATPPGGSATAISQSAMLLATQRADQPTEIERWTFSAGAVTAEGARFTPSRTSLDTAVSFGDTARVDLRYTIATGALAVAVTGLPAGLAGNVKVLGPGADTTARAVTATTTLTGLEPGRYRVVSTPVSQQGITYRPASDTLAVDVSASLVAAPAPVAYAAQVGRLVLQSSGLPAGSPAALRVVGNGIDRSFAGPGTVDSLPVGTYSVTAAPVFVGTDRWAATPSPQTITVTTGTASTASFTYALASGAITVSFSGLPAELDGDVRMTGPDGYTRTVTSAETVRGLEPGRYTLTPRVVRTATEAFGVQAGAATIDVSAGATPATAAFTYVLVPTVIDVPVTGLPNGTNAAIQLTDPAGANYAVTGSFRVVPAAAGRWRQTAANVSNSVASYAPSRTARDTTVSPGDTLGFGVHYTITSGSLAVVVSGLPNGSNAAVTVTGPGGYSRTLTATTTLVLLTPGTYTVAASPVTTGSGTYAPATASQNVAVSASSVAAGATVTYALPSGSVAISASGYPGGSSPVFTLTGPGSTRTQNGPGTVTGLAAGTWTVSAASVSASGTTYNASPSSTSTTVTIGATSTVSFTYAAVPAGTNYTISNVYLTQAIQKLDNSVALVANRAALLRVFVTANAANSARPDVRVRIYDGATLLSTTTIAAPEASVRTSIAEGTLTSTWNMTVPAGDVRTTMRVLVDLDPAQAVPDASRSDNTWPSSGTPQTVTVRSVPTFTVRFVPVITGTDTGRVSNANQSSFLVTTRRIWPLQNVVSDVRAPFTSSADTLQSNDANGKWLTVLSEVNALRTTDGAPSTTHYYGIVRVRYSSGIAGYGYQPGRAGVGWDYLPSGDNVAAHEWGHNFGRQHAPCGVGGDPNYPYANGVIGAFGWNSGTNAIVSSSATDIMSYCSNNWVSDYNWTAVMNYRNTSGYVTTAEGANAGDGLLVWGRVVDGRIELEPSFRVNAPVTPAPRGATHQVELLDAGGAALLTVPLEASVVDHIEPGHEQRQFAVVLPWSATLEQRLQQVRVRDVRVPMRAALQRAGTAAVGARALADAPAEQLERSARQVRVRWDNPSYRMAMVRDAATGQIMGFVRRQGAAVATGGRNVEVVFSDGVRSVVRR